jgi:hypothetical protein
LAASVHGSNIDAAFEATDGAVYCYDCGLTHIDVSSMLVGITFAFANPSGRGFEAFTPTAASLLVDSGTDVSDRNGSRPGRFEGSAADRGAVEQSAP